MAVLWVDIAPHPSFSWFLLPAAPGAGATPSTGVVVVVVVAGSQERQDKLRDMGVVDILHKLSQSSDPNLCDK